MLANTNGQKLSHHSVAVARMAVSLFDYMDIQEDDGLIVRGLSNKKIFRDQLFLAGILHDIGKIDKSFQHFLSNKISGYPVSDSSISSGTHLEVDGKGKTKDSPFSFNEYPRHNEVSWALCLSLFKNKVPDTVSHCVYYHHEQILRNNEQSGKNTAYSQSIVLSKIMNASFKGIQYNTHLDVWNDCKTFFAEVLELLNTNENTSLVQSHLNSDNVRNLDDFCDNCQNKTGAPIYLFDALENAPKDLKIENFKIENEVARIFMRSLLVSADRLVSSLSIKELSEALAENDFDIYVKKHLKENNNLHIDAAIEKMVDVFAQLNETSEINKQRDAEQNKAAKSCSVKSKPVVLFGPAGCGKTKIFLQWCLEQSKRENKTTKKIFIIAPRKTVCLGLYNELRNDYFKNDSKNSDAVHTSVEVVLGDKKSTSINGVEMDLDVSNVFHSDIVITTLDQIISLMCSHKKIDALLEVLHSHVVFDEFHEFFDIPGLVVLFKAILMLKTMFRESKTLLVSATPNYYFVRDFLDIDDTRVIEVPTFNKAVFNIELLEYKVEKDGNKYINVDHPMFIEQNAGDLLVFNTATASQKSALNVLANENEKTIVFHSKFTVNDKQKLIDNILVQWGKNSNFETPYTLRSGPIVQASLNISSLKMFTEICVAENWCQRLGRVNRFGDTRFNGIFTTAIPSYIFNNEDGFGNENVIRFLRGNNSENQTKSWIGFLLNYAKTSLNPSNVFESETGDIAKYVYQMTLSEIYKLYKEFHNQPQTQKAYQDDFNAVLSESRKAFLANDFTPFWFPNTKMGSKKLSKNSLRGSSVFILPMRWDITKNTSSWLYKPSESEDIPKSKKSKEKYDAETTSFNEGDVLTVEKTSIFVPDDANCFIKNQQHYINTIKTSFSSYPSSYGKKNAGRRIAQDGRSPQTPVFVTYPPDLIDKQINFQHLLVYVERTSANGDLVLLGLMNNLFENESLLNLYVKSSCIKNDLKNGK